MLVKLLNDFKKTRLVYKRRAAILKSQKEDKTHFWLIKKFCEEKYKIAGEVDVPILISAQKKSLYNNLNNKTLHKKLYKGLFKRWFLLRTLRYGLNMVKYLSKERRVPYAFSKTEIYFWVSQRDVRIVGSL
ncbi:hypothetical protein NGRA_2886 [Nosema granulosis]|uniref:Uncharacterized protein n=1 Tax=Nosema granulosis TaxID=83296 RepID=A0A9P6KY08_9MICR|nr:hypothetical protein NGRA_2886 [Nosema granulosis]